jgi:hypothetical protein
MAVGTKSSSFTLQSFLRGSLPLFTGPLDREFAVVARSGATTWFSRE